MGDTSGLVSRIFRRGTRGYAALWVSFSFRGRDTALDRQLVQTWAVNHLMRAKIVIYSLVQATRNLVVIDYCRRSDNLLEKP